VTLTLALLLAYSALLVGLGVWIGRRLSDAEAMHAVREGVTAVVDLSGEFSEARPFLRLGYRHIPVLDGDGNLVGILTDRDLRQVIFDPSIQEQLGNLGRAFNILTAKEVMTWGVITVRPESDIKLAARLMHEQKIGGLVVVEDGKVVGILTEVDLLKAFAEMLEECIVSKPERWGVEW